jgi:hypothetical protein
LVVDGNFKVDHVQQKNRADDVFLTDGELYMTAKGAYEEYLHEATKLAPRYSQVCVSSVTIGLSDLNCPGCNMS